jgi:hypothetical protein
LQVVATIPDHSPLDPLLHHCRLILLGFLSFNLSPNKSPSSSIIINNHPKIPPVCQPVLPSITICQFQHLSPIPKPAHKFTYPCHLPFPNSTHNFNPPPSFTVLTQQSPSLPHLIITTTSPLPCPIPPSLAQTVA